MNGILIINKTKGYTSHDIVHKVKKITHEKVGHTGTLDPMAEGVLPLLIGKGTLCSQYLINHDKIYQVVLQLGEKRDTADSEGNVVEKQEVQQELWEQGKIEDVLKSFLGKQEQIPPIYSAIKVKGKKLYEYARKGQTVEIQPRQIEIYAIELIQFNIENQQIDFQVSCSKGTYIRSLCEDIAQRLGTIGYMKELKRIQVGDFSLKDSVTLEELEKDLDTLQEHLISLKEVFEDYPKIELEEKQISFFLNGVKLTKQLENGIYQIYCNQELIGTGTVENYLLKRDIIL